MVAADTSASAVAGSRRVAAPADPSLGAPTQPAPGTLVVNASRLRDFATCGRRYYLASILGVSADESDESDAASVGMELHAELRARHDLTGDDARLRHDGSDPVDPEGSGDPRVMLLAQQHARICPSREGATYVGGEVDLRWLVVRRNILLTGRVDAVWRWPDGTVEIRDYKTGGCPETLTDDQGAAVYALLARAAVPGAHPSRRDPIRVSYERLRGEAPAVISWDLTDDDLRAAFARVETFADQVRREQRFAASPSGAACGACGYRRICPHAHTTSEFPNGGGAGRARIVDAPFDEGADPF